MKIINRLASLTTIVFDWGNTLMKELPYSGPMVDWPIVEAVPGALTTLQVLKQHYQLVIATNAAQSTANHVETALARVGMAGLMDEIFTSNELESQKPESGFFTGICDRLGTQPTQMLMVGDTWKVDIAGANQSGWSAAWYNPTCTTCPGLWPNHQIEIRHMADLPKRLPDLNLPRPHEALNWLQEQGTSQTILIHVQLVAALAYQMAEWLAARGECVNPVLAQRGGLMHDLAKLSASQPNSLISHHGDLAAFLLSEIQQPALAEIARRHLFYLPLEAERYQPRSWEEKLVYYADKLVESTRLVNLSERISLLNLRYPTEVQRFAAGMPAAMNLEKEICQILDISADELLDTLKRALYTENSVFIERSG